jgi:ankyrin repeat protein
MSCAQATLAARISGDHTALMYAALSGRTAEVKALLAKGADVNARDYEGRTALMFAAVNLHGDTVNTLLDHGAEVNTRATDGGTALILAVCGGATDIVQSLLNRGADLDGKFAMTNRTALVIATERGYTQIVELLKSNQGHQPPLTQPGSDLFPPALPIASLARALGQSYLMRSEFNEG